MPNPNHMPPIRTPLLRTAHETGALWLKNETEQPSGSFKLRGPTRFLERNDVPTGTVTAASSGNHAIGLSMAARDHGYRAVIWVPAATPESKLSRIAAAGAEIRTVDGDYEAALVAATQYAEYSGAVLVPSYDHDDVIDGNADIFREIIEQLGRRPDRVFVPVGGGGLVSAALSVFEGTGTEVIGVELAPYRRIEHLVFDSDDTEIPPVAEPLLPSMEGVAIRCLGGIPKSIIRASANLGLASIEQYDLINASRWLWATQQIRAELGGCLGLAATLLAATNDSLSVAVLSGGNIDPHLHAELIATA